MLEYGKTALNTQYSIILCIPLFQSLISVQSTDILKKGQDKPILLFDGVCNLCSFFVNFTIKRDKQSKFVFASLQSETGKKLLQKFDLPTTDFHSLILINNNEYFTRSTAALKIVKEFSGLWPAVYILMIIPKPVRDFFYDIIAKNRYVWFGKKDQCFIPATDIESRFC